MCRYWFAAARAALGGYVQAPRGIPGQWGLSMKRRACTDPDDRQAYAAFAPQGVANLLDVARIETGALSVNPGPSAPTVPVGRAWARFTFPLPTVAARAHRGGRQGSMRIMPPRVLFCVSVLGFLSRR